MKVELQIVVCILARNQLDISRASSSDLLHTLFKKQVLVESYLEEAKPHYLEKLVIQLRKLFQRKQEPPK